MTKLAISADGKLLLNDDLLKHLGLSPGGNVVVSKLPNGRIELRAARQAGSITDVFGVLKRDGRRALSIGQMSRIAAEGWPCKR